MTGAAHSNGDTARGTGNPARGAAIDLLLVLGTLFAVKELLLRFDALWTYAGPISLVTSVVVASWCLYRNRESWAELGLRRPENMPRMLLWAFVILVVTMVAGVAIELGITSVGLGSGDVDPRFSSRFANLPGNTPMFLFWVFLSWMVGGFVEEMLFRGMLISRFGRLLAGFPYAIPIAVVLQSIIFGYQHYYYQGWSGALATGGIALLSGLFYILLKRSLWPLILSHGAANTIGMTLIYTGVQSAG